jgi:diguanylate cyclase (GGDEF)-like protein
MSSHGFQFRSDADRDAERGRLERIGRVSVLAALPLMGILVVAGSVAARLLFPHLGSLAHDFAAGGIAVAGSAPFAVLIYRISLQQNLKISEAGADHEREMAKQARRRDFETRLANALEMADGEPEVLDAIERALGNTLPEAPAEMLLADNSHAHLSRMVVASPTGEPPGCDVDSPARCPAARRAQVQRFGDSDDLDACPKLRGRQQGRCSAVCVPVSIMGRTVGVIHATGAAGHPVDETRVQDLQTLASLAGNRIGMIRIMAETQLQASTDGLTGLVNRRTFENRTATLRNDGNEFALVMVDLDHFKDLNDTFGHETGDRALRLFAETLRRSVRRDDLACRYGGEEFAIVLPHATVTDAIDVLERVRVGVRSAISAGNAPTFTASFGIALSSSYADLDEVVARADQALFDAKDAGRDCLWVDGETAAVPAPLCPPTLVATAITDATG